MFHFYNTFLNLLNNSPIFSSVMTNSSTGSCFTILSSFNLITASAILCPGNLLALWTTFLQADFRESSHVFIN